MADGRPSPLATGASALEDFTGRFVLHFHILNHEEIGMLQLIEVYKA